MNQLSIEFYLVKDQSLSNNLVTVYRITSRHVTEKREDPTKLNIYIQSAYNISLPSPYYDMRGMSNSENTLPGKEFVLITDLIFFLEIFKLLLFAGKCVIILTHRHMSGKEQTTPACFETQS